jgi:hypothetical protein
MPSEKRTIVGISGRSPNLDVLTLTSTGEAVCERRAIEVPEAECHKLIEKLGSDRFITLSRINSGAKVLFYTINGKKSQAELPKNANLMSLFADNSGRKIYSWDTNSKRILRFNENGELEDSYPTEGTPFCYSQHNGTLIIGFAGGNIFYGNKKIAKMNGHPSKLIVSGRNLIALSSETKAYNTFAMPSLEISLTDFQPVKNSRINGKILDDVIEHNGIRYHLANNSISAWSYGRKAGEKAIEGIGKIFALHPFNDLIAYRTLSGIYITHASDFLKGTEAKEKAKLLEKKHYESIIII